MDPIAAQVGVCVAGLQAALDVSHGLTAKRTWKRQERREVYARFQAAAVSAINAASYLRAIGTVAGNAQAQLLCAVGAGAVFELVDDEHAVSRTLRPLMRMTLQHGFAEMLVAQQAIRTDVRATFAATQDLSTQTLALRRDGSTEPREAGLELVGKVAAVYRTIPGQRALRMRLPWATAAWSLREAAFDAAAGEAWRANEEFSLTARSDLRSRWALPGL